MRVPILLWTCISLAVVGCGGGGTPVAPTRVLVGSDAGAMSQDGSTLQVPNEMRVVASGNWGAQATGTIQVWDKPQVEVSGGTLVNRGYTIAYSNSALTETTTLDVVLRTPVAANSKVWQLALGSFQNLKVVETLGVPFSTNEIKFTLTKEDLEWDSAPSRSSDRIVDLTLASWDGGADNDQRFFESPDYGSASRHIYWPSNRNLQQVNQLNPIQAGEHVAVVVHGLNNSASSMTDLAYVASRIVQFFGNSSTANPQLKYDRILFFDYQDSVYSIHDNGDALAVKLRELGVEDSASLDFYGHSMGGLVSRWAIEKRGIGQYTTRLFTFGTPHKGVPRIVLGLNGWFLTTFIPGIYDLGETSQFMADLNSSDSPFKNRVAYYALAGTNFDYFTTIRILGEDRLVFFGPTVKWHYERLGWTGPVDGIAAQYSAHPSDLGRFGKSSLGSMLSLPFNHSDIGGVQEDLHPKNQQIIDKLKEMLRANGSGVIR